MTLSSALKPKLQGKLSQRLIQRLEILSLSKRNLQKLLISLNSSINSPSNKTANFVYNNEQNTAISNAIEDELFQHFNINENLSENQQKTLRSLIGNLDNSGFLCESIGVIAKENHISPNDVNSLRRKMMEFENLGIGCYHFQEFLGFQLANNTSKFKKILPTLLILLSKKIFPGKRPFFFLKSIRKQLPSAEWQRILEELRRGNLQLKPLHHSEFSSHYDANPDLEIRAINGKWDIVYYNAEEELNFLEAKELPSSSFEKIRHSLIHRRHTLLQIGDEIFKIQQPFLWEGIGRLNPLPQSQLAHSLQLAPSTISRAIRGKCIKTPNGTFPLALFLQSAKQLFATKMQFQLRQLWKNNPDALFLCDKDLARLFENEYGVTLSRRTICKYRNRLLN